MGRLFVVIAHKLLALSWAGKGIRLLSLCPNLHRRHSAPVASITPIGGSYVHTGC